MAASPHLPADDDVSQSFEETSRCSEVWKQSGPKTDDWDRKQAQKESLQLQFQESHLSPSLSLLPVASGEELSFTEPSFFQQSDSEFAPLRAYPDISVASERLCVPLQDQTNHWSEPSLLSQHPLAQATILSEEGTNTLSEHILSPGIKNKEEKKARPHQKAATATGQGLWREGTGRQEGELETLTEVTDKNFRDVFQDDISFLNNDVPAQHLLDLLQKEVGMQSSSSSSISSASQSSEKRTGSLMDDSKRTQTSKAITDQSLATREHPPGEASLHQQQTRPSEVRNITMGSRSTQPDDSSELLHTELLAEAHRLGDLEAESKNKQKAEMQSCQFSASLLKEESERRPRGKAGLGSVQRMAPFLAATDWVRREQELLLSQSKTEIDGSYLGFLPQSQSTPGVFMAQMKTTLGQLSAIKSDKNATYQSVTPQPAVSKMDICFPDQLRQSKDGSVQTSAEVQSLPSLNFRQKVDAWRTKPTPVSGFSSPDPGGSGLTLNRTITPQAGTSLRLSATGAAQLNVPQNGSLALSGSSSPRRGEAVRGGPGDKISGGSAAPPIASPLGRSQSHSSLSTVITSVCKHQHPDVPPEEEQSHNRDHAPQSPGTSVHPSSLTGLGRFSDVSPDQVLTCSSSQDSCGGTKVGASVGTSSVVSLELDNYAPYWTSKSTPPPPSKPQELNIDERIPLYLYILGVDQSPSNILTPFAPRDPTREPEFSPTDLCTIKGSTGTPSKGTQASEGSDDAVPPHFSSQVLGKQDPGLDRGVSFRHPEGIYSKRLQMAGSEHTDGSLPAVSRAPTSSFQASATRSPSTIHQKVSLSRDQGTSPVQFLPYKQTDPGGVHPAYRETIPTFVPQKRHLEPQQSSRTMDQMWKWTMESSRPTRDREALLLEHLSHLLHHMEADDPGVQERRDPDPEEQLSRTQRRRATVRRDVGLQVEATLQPEQEAGHAPFSHSSSQSHRLSPVDREGTSSTVSSSVSTVDTTRLVRAFGAHRVQQLKSSSSLRKLYCSISRQRRGNLTNPPHDLTPSEPTRSEGSVAPDSGSSSSWFPSHHGPSTALTAKRTVKLANKSVQAGDLEIVKNGTRRHTRDVGTTFPSPGETRALGQISSSPSLAVRGRRRQKSPKPHKKIKPVPKGVSWFISAESLKSETKKENRPEGSTAGRLSTAWFEPYRTLRLWKEPLRQIYEDNQSCSGEPDPDPKTRTMSSGLTRVSLQEALEMRCPGFISRSRQRLRRLALRAEERKLHAVLSRDTNLVFNQRGGPVKLPKPAGTGLLLRAVPRREMIQRSKQMYENLPEVQRRREEERRRAEYQVYRLNARLYNKRITNRVLGRREAWH
uniref:Alstrom syndrome 1 n=1 Tax=Nothobranchius furzeri TaxID=105023 RepID=A0A1A8ATC1_NOTFU